MNMKNLTMALLLVSFALGGCKNAETQEQALQAVKVETLRVKPATAANVGRYSGTIEEENGTALSFNTAGTVQKVYIHLGQRVRAGELIATLDPVTLQSSYNAARATLEQAEDAYRRMKELYDKGSLTDIKWVEVQSQLEQARSMEQIASKSLRDSKLYAPFTGMIAEKSVEVGQNVAPGVPVAKLVTTSQLKVKITVPETEISSIAIGQASNITVPALGGKAFSGKVMEKGVVADPFSRSYEVKIRIDDADGKLMPGMVVEASLATSGKRSVCILPAHIVQIDSQNRFFVWVDRDGKAERRFITCSDYTDNGVIVTEGLQPGENVIVKGQNKVCNGTPLLSDK